MGSVVCRYTGGFPWNEILPFTCNFLLEVLARHVQSTQPFSPRCLIMFTVSLSAAPLRWFTRRCLMQLECAQSDNPWLFPDFITRLLDLKLVKCRGKAEVPLRHHAPSINYTQAAAWDINVSNLRPPRLAPARPYYTRSAALIPAPIFYLPTQATIIHK